MCSRDDLGLSLINKMARKEKNLERAIEEGWGGGYVKGQNVCSKSSSLAILEYTRCKIVLHS